MYSDMDVGAFVREALPPPPARVLEVGCGRGELARGLADQGYAVTAIDPEAPGGEPFQRVALEDFADPGPFDAVVASRSLHHIADLPGALEKIVRLTACDGRLIVHEFAWDRLDEPTARWYVGHHAPPHAERHASLDEFLDSWRHEHAGLHGYAAMRMELDRRLDERFFAWTPYLYRELGDSAAQEELALMEAGTIQATGFFYVGEPNRYLSEGRP